ncbi:MAG: DUF4136 domain-containing protein [Niabella sp.]
MKKNILFLAGVFGLLVVLAGCGPTAHVEKARNVDFSQYRSFAWAQTDKDGRRRANLTEQRVKDAISSELNRKLGWTQARRNPDIILSYDVLVERGRRVQSDPVYTWGGFRTFYNPYSRRFFNVYYPSRFMGYDNYTVPTREGTIAITMVDASTDRTILQAWATDEINNRRMTTKDVDRIVNAIFRKWNIR